MNTKLDVAVGFDPGSAENLNRGCVCRPLDPDRLHRELDAEPSLAGLCEDIARSRPHLFAATAVFISREQFNRIAAMIAAVESVVGLPGYRKSALARAPCIAQLDPGLRGVFVGYDFHLTSHGPQLIEINTNAGGALLNAVLARSQKACCREMVSEFEPTADLNNLEQTFFAMFAAEWRRQRGEALLGRVAIVDDDPAGQYLYPEMRLFERLFARFGTEAVIADARELIWREGQSDDSLAALDVAAELRAIFVAGVPRTVSVTPEQSDTLWAERRKLFFKPAAGYGSKAAYRGDKLTRRVWQEILHGNYVAQALVAPSERHVEVDSAETDLKLDVRAYVFGGAIQLVAARLYEGQTTNFRTPGGGFAPVFVVNPGSENDLDLG